jgi:hypothetical protein
MAQAREDRKEGFILKLLKDDEIQAEVDEEELDEGGKFSKNERIIRGLYILYEKVYEEYNTSKQREVDAKRFHSVAKAKAKVKVAAAESVAKFRDCEIILELMREQNSVGEEWEGIINDKEEELKKLVDGAVGELPLPPAITREIAFMVRSKSKRKKKTKRSKSKRRKSKRRKSNRRKSNRRKSKEVSL